MLQKLLKLYIATKRDAVEAAIVDMAPEMLLLPEEAWPLINQYKKGNFGFSYLGFSLYANGYNDHSLSTNYPRGLVYFNPETATIFGLGVFFRPNEPEVPNLHIIAPQGENWRAEVSDFSSKVQVAVPALNIYVRHLIKGSVEPSKKDLGKSGVQNSPANVTNNQLAILRHGFEQIGAKPWLQDAAQEDEQENRGRVFVLKRLLKERPENFSPNNWARSWYNSLQIKDNHVENPKDGYLDVIHPEKVWKAVDRFENFMKRNDLEYILLPYTEESKPMAREIVQGHFDDLRDAQKAIGSTAADYENLIHADTHLVPGIHMFLGYLKKRADNQRSVPVSFFGFEEISGPKSQKMAGGYATITRRNPESIASLIDVPEIGEGNDIAEHGQLIKGFSAIAAYAMCQVMKELQAQRGVKIIDLGGSETPDLALGKQHMGGHPRETFWVVRTAKAAPETELRMLQ